MTRLADDFAVIRARQREIAAERTPHEMADLPNAEPIRPELFSFIRETREQLERFGPELPPRRRELGSRRVGHRRDDLVDRGTDHRDARIASRALR